MTCVTCGHDHLHHFGTRGPCIAGTPGGEASVCPCDTCRCDDCKATDD